MLRIHKNIAIQPKMPPSNQVRLDGRRLWDECVARKYKRELAESLGELTDFDDPEKLWTDFENLIRSPVCEVHLDRRKAL